MDKILDLSDYRVVTSPEKGDGEDRCAGCIGRYNFAVCAKLPDCTGIIYMLKEK